jgi:uncharacterized protein (TIGR00106 family)
MPDTPANSILLQFSNPNFIRSNDMSTLLEFSIFPTDKGESVSVYVSRVIDLIKHSGVKYQLTSMGTIIETGSLGEALSIVEKSYEILATQGCNRVYASLKIDVRKGKGDRMKQKVESIQEKIGSVPSTLKQ